MSQPLVSPATLRGRSGTTGGRRTSGASGVRLGPSSRPVRLPELLIGVLVVATCALAAVMWQRSMTDGQTVVVAAASVARGDTIEADDLMAAEVRGAGSMTLIAGSDAVDLIGTVALVDIVPGDPLTRSMVAAIDPLSPDEGLASVSLARGQAPGGLSTGDSVRVVVVPQPDALGEAEPTVLPVVATVWEVEAATEYEPTSVVTLRLPLADAASVAGADSVRLVRVEP